MFYNYLTDSKLAGNTSIGEESRTKRRTGFIAEEVREVIPEVVLLNENGLAESVDYDDFVAVNTRAIQELDGKVQEFEGKVQEWGGKVQELDGRVQELDVGRGAIVGQVQELDEQQWAQKDRLKTLEQENKELREQNELIKSELCKRDNGYSFCSG